MTVISLPDQEVWKAVNLTKASIRWMQERKDKRFDEAIRKEEELLEEFFEQFRSKGEAENLSSAA